MRIRPSSAAVMAGIGCSSSCELVRRGDLVSDVTSVMACPGRYSSKVQPKQWHFVCRWQQGHAHVV